MTLRCKCGLEKTREITEPEQALCEAITESLGTDTHGLWHEWQNRLKDGDEYKLTGYELMQAADEFEEEFPDSVSIHRIDDAYFSSSYFVIVHHGTGDNYMGASCVVISQNAPYPPLEFFTYPGHASSVIEGLKGVVKRAGNTSFMTRHRNKPSSFDAFRPAKIIKSEWYQQSAPLVVELAQKLVKKK